ncbi:Guanine nucleotide exchange factor lte1 [Sorochytrium milnesiophthora]
MASSPSSSSVLPSTTNCTDSTSTPDAVDFKSPLFAALSSTAASSSSSSSLQQQPLPSSRLQQQPPSPAMQQQQQQQHQRQKLPAYLALQPKIQQGTHRAPPSLNDPPLASPATSTFSSTRSATATTAATASDASANPARLRFNNHNKEYEQLARIYGWETPTGDDQKAAGLLNFKLPSWLKPSSSSVASSQQQQQQQQPSQSRRIEDQLVSSLAVAPSKSNTAPPAARKRESDDASFTSFSIPPALHSDDHAALETSASSSEQTAWTAGHHRSYSTPDDHNNITAVAAEDALSAQQHQRAADTAATTPLHRRGNSDQSIRSTVEPAFQAFPPPSVYLSSESSSSENRQSFLEDHYVRPPTIIHSRSAADDVKQIMSEEPDDDDYSDRDESCSDQQPPMSATFAAAAPTPKSSTLAAAKSPNVDDDLAPTRMASPARSFQSSIHPPQLAHPPLPSTLLHNIPEYSLPEENDFGLPVATHPFWTFYPIFDTIDADNNIRYASTSSSSLASSARAAALVTSTAGGTRLMGATPTKLIEVLTTTVDYTFLSDFLLVYRSFMSPVQFAKLLILRFRWAMAGESDRHMLARMRTFIVLRNWITDYYASDFISCRPLRFIIITFINELSHNINLRAQKRDYRLIKALKKLLKQHDSDYKRHKTLHAQMAPDMPLTEWLFRVDMEKEYDQINAVLSNYLERAQVHMSGGAGTGSSGNASTSSVISSSSSSGMALHHPHALTSQMSFAHLVTPPVSHTGSPDGYFASSQASAGALSVPAGQSSGWAARRMSTSELSINTAAGTAKREWSLKSSISSFRKHMASEMYFAGNGGGGGYDGYDADTGEAISSDVYRRVHYERTLSTASAATTTSTVSNISCASSGVNSIIATPVTSPGGGGGSSYDASPLSPSPVSTVPTTTLAHLSWALAPLSRTPVVDKETGRRKSFILAFKSEVIAQHFTIIEETLLRCVRWTDLLEGRWKKSEQSAAAAGRPTSWSDADAPPPPTKAGERYEGIQVMIERFNLTCQWIATEICSTKSIDERVKIIEKLIRIANKCYAMANYSTLTQIMLGLQNPHVDRLKKTWAKVSSPERKAFKDLSAFTSPLKNFAGLREAMKQVTEGDGHGIPFTGLYLSDLVFNNELPSYLSANATGDAATPAATNDLTAPQPLVNYHKFQITASIIAQFRAFQDPRRRYHLDMDLRAYACCLCLRTVSNDDLAQLSTECEARDAKK